MIHVHFLCSTGIRFPSNLILIYCSLIQLWNCSLKVLRDKLLESKYHSYTSIWNDILVIKFIHAVDSKVYIILSYTYLPTPRACSPLLLHWSLIMHTHAHTHAHTHTHTHTRTHKHALY